MNNKVKRALQITGAGIAGCLVAYVATASSYENANSHSATIGAIERHFNLGHAGTQGFIRGVCNGQVRGCFRRIEVRYSNGVISHYQIAFGRAFVEDGADDSSSYLLLPPECVGREVGNVRDNEPLGTCTVTELVVQPTRS